MSSCYQHGGVPTTSIVSAKPGPTTRALSCALAIRRSIAVCGFTSID